MKTRWQLTTHAVERYLERVAPDLAGDHERAANEIRAALGSAQRDREAERLRVGKKGQVLAATPFAGGRPNVRRALTHFIVLPPSDPTTCGRSVVISCWPSDFTGDESAELRAAEREATASAPPKDWTPLPSEPLPGGSDWGSLVGRIEVARMRSLAYKVELAKAGVYRDVLIELAAVLTDPSVVSVSALDLLRRIQAGAPELVEIGDRRRRLGIAR